MRAFSKKNADTSCGPSGESPHIWWQCLSLPDDIAQRFANYANNCVANNLAQAARDVVVAKRGTLVHKADQTPDEVPGRPLGIGNCDPRAILPPHALGLRSAFANSQHKTGDGRIQLGVGVPGGYSMAAADLLRALSADGNVCQKGDKKNAFNSVS